MDGAPRRRLVIDLEPGTGPIHGWLHEEGGTPLFFAGWLELSSALEQAWADGCTTDELSP